MDDNTVVYDLDIKVDGMDERLKQLEDALQKADDSTKKASSSMSEKLSGLKEGLGETLGGAGAAAAAVAGAVVAAGAAFVSLALGVEKGASKSLKDFKKESDKALYGLQLIASESGVVQSVLKPFNDLVQKGTKYIKDNNVQLQHMALDVLDALADALMTVEPLLTMMAKVPIGIYYSTQLAGNGLAILAAAAYKAGTAIVDSVVGGLKSAVDSLTEFIGSAADMAESMGADGIAGALRDGMGTVASFGDTVSATAKQTEEWNKQADLMLQGTVDGAKAILEEADQVLATVDKFVSGGITSISKGVKEASSEARKEIKDLTSLMEKGRPSGEAAEPNTSVQDAIAAAMIKRDEAAKKADERQKKALEDQIKLAKELAGLNIVSVDDKILQAKRQGNEQLVIQLEYEKRLLEIQMQRQFGEQDRLTLAQLEMEQKQALFDMESAMHDQRMKQINAELKAQAKAIDSFGAISNSLAMSSNKSVQSLGSITAALAEAGKNYGSLQKDGVSSSQAMAGAATGAAGTIGSALAAQTEDTKKAALIQGAFAAAQAALFGAQGNIPAAVGAGVASAMHFAVAATSGGGQGATGSQQGNVASSGSTVDNEEMGKRNAEYIADAIERANAQAKYEIMFNFSNSVLLQDGPEIQRTVVDSLMPEFERRGMSLGG